MKGKVGYVGPFCDNNFGDFGMLINDIYDFDIKDIVLFTWNPQITQDIKKKYLTKEFRVQDVFIHIPEVERIQTGKAYQVTYEDHVDSMFEILQMTENLEEIKQAVKSLKMLIVTGGGWMNDVWCAKHRKQRLYSIIVPIILAAKLNVPIVYMGNTFGPFKISYEFFLNFIAATYKKSTYASRDDFSSKFYLTGMGIDSIQSLPDDFYFLNFRLLNRKCSESITQYINKGPYIILENYMSVIDLEKHIKDIEKFVKIMKEKYGRRVLFLPLGNGYGGSYQGNLLKEKIENLDFFSIDDHKIPKVEDIENLINHAEFIICHRYHMFVRSLANNIPVVQILKDVCESKNYYYTKGIGILSKMLPETKEEMFFRIDYWETLEEIQKFYQEKRYDFKKIYEDSMKAIKEAEQRKVRNNYIEMMLCRYIE